MLLPATGDTKDVKNNGDKTENLRDKKYWFDMIKH